MKGTKDSGEFLQKANHGLSIVIPAYNEGERIKTCVDSFLSGISGCSYPVEVIVVCNGCVDDTFAQASTIKSEFLRVYNVDKPSKTNALNFGDSVASLYPRVYLDADVVVDFSCLDSLKRAFDDDAGLLVASPGVKLNLDGITSGAKAYYHIWQKLPYFNEGIGFGIYALSEKGRERFGAFPLVIGDDEYVRRMFTSKESKRLQHCSYSNTPAGSLRGLIRQNVRTEYGNLELAAMGSSYRQPHRANSTNSLIQTIQKPYDVFALGCYLFVRLYSKIVSKVKFRRNVQMSWQRDRRS